MAKTKISEFSSTPANNTDIDSINIAEGCAPSGINNAIRELMAQLKDFQTGAAGDSFNGPVGTTTAAAGAFTTLSASGTVSGTGFSNYLASPPAIGGTTAAAGSFTTLTTSGAVTHNAGTANGVAYLNGSKVLTTGSALTFDGTNLGIGTASPGALLGVNGTAMIGNQAGSGTSGSFAVTGAGGAIYIQSGQNTASGSYAPLVFTNMGAATEYMRLTSTGLGIGTSSPSGRLSVASTSSTNSSISSWSSAYSVFGPNSGSTTGAALALGYNTSLDQAEIVSMAAGVAWKPLKILSAGLIFASESGSTAATIDSSGNLGLGVTPSAWGTGASVKGFQLPGVSLWGYGGTNAYLNANAYYNGTNRIYTGNGYATEYEQSGGNHVWKTAPSGTAGNAISFTQAMTLDASGNLGIGQTAPGAKLEAAGNLRITNSSAGNSAIFQVTSDATGSNGVNLEATYYGSGGFGPIKFTTSNTERARIDSSGNLLLSTTSTGGYSGFIMGAGKVIISPGTYTNTTATAGNMGVAADGAFYRSTSALKYKQDIRDVEDFDISALRPVRYKSKCENDDQTKDHLGLIADEAADAGFEELVTRNANGEIEGFQYERLTVVLLKKLQTLTARIESLEAK